MIPADHEHTDSSTMKRWACQCGAIDQQIPDNWIMVGETANIDEVTGACDFHVEPPGECKLLSQDEVLSDPASSICGGYNATATWVGDERYATASVDGCFHGPLDSLT